MPSSARRASALCVIWRVDLGIDPYSLLNAPPYLSFRLAEKKDSAAPGIAGRRCQRQKKAARNLRSRALGGPLRSRPGKGNCGKVGEERKGRSQEVYGPASPVRRSSLLARDRYPVRQLRCTAPCRRGGYQPPA